MFKNIRKFDAKGLQIDISPYVDEVTVVIGDVIIKEDVLVWSYVIVCKETYYA